MLFRPTSVNTCHKTGGIGATFATVHPAFDSVKYDSVASAEAGTLRYTYVIDDVVYDDVNDSLTVTWGAKDAADAAVNVPES